MTYKKLKVYKGLVHAEKRRIGGGGGMKTAIIIAAAVIGIIALAMWACCSVSGGADE